MAIRLLRGNAQLSKEHGFGGWMVGLQTQGQQTVLQSQVAQILGFRATWSPSQLLGSLWLKAATDRSIDTNGRGCVPLKLC